MSSPIASFTEMNVQFETPEDCARVHQLMNGGMRFVEAIDYLELRPFTHFSVTRTSTGPDGRTDA